MKCSDFQRIFLESLEGPRDGMPPLPGIPPHHMNPGPHSIPPGVIPPWDQSAQFFPGPPPGMGLPHPDMGQFDENSPHHPAFVGFDGIRPPGPLPPMGSSGMPDGLAGIPSTSLPSPGPAPGPFPVHSPFPPGSEPQPLPSMSLACSQVGSSSISLTPPNPLPSSHSQISGNESRPFDQGHQNITGHVTTLNSQPTPGQPTQFNHSPEGSRCSISPRDSGYDSCEVVKHEC